MSERNPKRFENGSNAQERSPEEQRRLMEEYDQARYEEAFPADEEAAFNDRMAERKRQEEYDANLLIESRIMENAEAQRMYMMAQHIAELKTTDGEPTIIADKEDKLRELLLEYAKKAHADRDLEFRNAEMERDTVKGRDIRASKELAAEAELAKRLEEADFIVKSTDDAWVKEKTSKTTETTPADIDKGLVKDKDHARVLADVEEISRLIKADPEAARKAGAYEKLRDLMRQIDEILAKAKGDEIGIPKDVKLDGTDEIGVPKDAKVGDDDEIGTPKDVVLTGGEGAPEPDREPGRRPNIFSRAYNRAYNFFSTYNTPASLLAHGLERFRDSRRAKVVAAVGSLAIIGLGIAGRHYGWFDGSHGGGVNHHDAQAGASAGASDGVTSGQTPGGFPGSPAELYPSGAHNITPGEGWYEAMSRAGIKDPSIQREILQNNSVMEKLHNMGLAYKAPELGGWGLNMTESGQIPDAALDVLSSAAKAAR